MTKPLVSALGLTKHFDELVAVDRVAARGGKWGWGLFLLERTVKETQIPTGLGNRPARVGKHAFPTLAHPLDL